MTATAFETDTLFRDPTNFPYGFSRSGDFTIQQAELLEKNGLAYKALSTGERKPKTPEEKAFVKFCKGDAEASSAHEKAWQRYQARINRTKVVYSLSKH